MKTGQIYECQSDGYLYIVIRRANVDYALVCLHDGQTIWSNGRTLEQLYNKTCTDVKLFTGKISVENGLTI